MPIILWENGVARDKSEIFDELSAALKKGLASGTLLTREQVATNMQVFRERFGPDVLKSLDGQALVRTMHGRAEGEARCLAYWLEFKNDDEFSGNRFGGIGGGSALKFGLFQRKEDAAWIRDGFGG